MTRSNQVSLKKKNIKAIIFSILLLVFILLLDIVTPLGIAVGVLYNFVLLLNIRNKKILTSMMLSSVVLVGFKFLISYSSEQGYIILLNRLIVIVSLVLTYILIIRFMRAKDKADKLRSGYVENLESMLTITSHKVRKPVVTCLGLMDLLDYDKPTKEELKKIYSYIKNSASELDIFTKELTQFIYKTSREQKPDKPDHFIENQ